MKNKSYIKIAKEVINLEIKSLVKLKKNLKNSFNQAVKEISKCQSKVILCGVGKSGIIASKIAATLSSVGTPSFTLSASDSSHGDLGSVSKKDILILISYSGETTELKNIVNHAKRNKILLIGIVSKKDSFLYKTSDIKLLLPQVKESEGIIPTSSTTSQLALGDALAISTMKEKKFSKFDFKKIHPSGNLAIKLLTAEDLMLTGKKIPFINENTNMITALKLMSNRNLGTLVAINKKKITKGIITDGQIRRFNLKRLDLKNTTVKQIMTKNPLSIDKNELAVKALSLMNSKKITCLCIYDKKNKNKTIGFLHIHHLLQANLK